ncbi:uncharacterized protein LOC130657919 [Hydractinia symbiolongicarpus]|uniref:uncharacterized protein LOC130657919 n=1 Tax=Hydractinia symbiolongicarpus TaxID=13093 RepID=UPI00254B81EB|nr:uncharacterized protein LOC130657919 [Hydractinia symbiolongicarpus]
MDHLSNQHKFQRKTDTYFSQVSKTKTFLCQQSKECNRIVSCSCARCSSKICDRCQNLHSCSNKSFISVIFNEKLQELQPLCKQHDSLAKYVCIDCENLFTCVYCTHRQHKNHRIKTVDDFGLEAKQWFQSFINSFDETKVVFEELTRKYNEALTSFKTEREIFARELKVRKLKRMTEYVKMLNAEEENHLKEFDEKVEEFKAQVILVGLLDNTWIKRFSDYIYVFNSKSHFELVAEKLEIERQLRSLTSFPKTILTFNSHLYQLKKEDYFTSPLGRVQVSVDDMSTIGIDPSKCSVYKNLIDECEPQPNFSELATNLKTLLKSLEEYERSRANVNLDGEKQRSSAVKQKDATGLSKLYSFEDLREIIQNGDDKKLQFVLINSPNIVKMRDDYGHTLLIEAARRNKPSIVQALIDAGSEVYAVNKRKWNAYHFSAKFDHQDVLKILINCDVTHINNVDNDNNTPLHLASARDHVECVKLLLSIPHINVNIQNWKNQTAYDVACNSATRRLLEKHRGEAAKLLDY